MIEISYTAATSTYPDEDPGRLTISAQNSHPVPIDLGLVADEAEAALMAAGQQVRRRTTTTTTTVTQVPGGTQSVTETTVLTGPWVGAQP